MLRTSSLYPLSREFKRRLSSVRGRLRRGLALWVRIRELGWHPVLRYAPNTTFRPTGGDRVPVRTSGGGLDRGIRTKMP